MKKKPDKNGCTIHVRLPCRLKKHLQRNARIEKLSLSKYVVKTLQIFG